MINDACCNTLQILCSKFLSFNYLSNDLSKQILCLFTLFPWKSLSVFQDLIMRLKIKYNVCVSEVKKKSKVNENGSHLP